MSVPEGKGYVPLPPNLVAGRMLNPSYGMQGEHFVVTSSCHFANAMFDKHTTFSYSVRLVLYGMAFPFLMSSVVLSRRRGGRDLVRDHRRQAYLMTRGSRVGGRRNALSEWGHKYSVGLRSLVELKHSGSVSV